MKSDGGKSQQIEAPSPHSKDPIKQKIMKIIYKVRFSWELGNEYYCEESMFVINEFIFLFIVKIYMATLWIYLGKP